MNSIALTESKSLRESTLSECTQDKAFEALEKAKALVLAYWKGERLATTVQLNQQESPTLPVLR